MELNRTDIESRIEEARRLRSEALGQFLEDGLRHGAALLAKAFVGVTQRLAVNAAVKDRHAIS